MTDNYTPAHQVDLTLWLGVNSNKKLVLRSNLDLANDEIGLGDVIDLKVVAIEQTIVTKLKE